MKATPFHPPQGGGCETLVWIRTACAGKLGILGEVYSELQGLQAWVVGQVWVVAHPGFLLLFKISPSELQIIEQKLFLRVLVFHAFELK